MKFHNDDKAMLISVIVPVYNVEKHVARCLDSICAQTYKNIEIICVNDASPDGSMLILKKYAKSDSRIKIIEHAENCGLGAARDTGIKNSTGAYLLFVDSDDYISTDYVSKFVESISDDIDILIGGYTRVEGNKSFVVPVVDNIEQPWTYVSACGKIFKKEFLERNAITFKSIRYYEDVPFNYRCMLSRPAIKVIDNSGYFYVLNPASITRSGNQELKYRTYISSLNEIGEEYAGVELSMKEREMLEYEFYQALTIGMLVNIRHLGPKKARRLYNERKTCLSRFVPRCLGNKNIGFSKLSCEYANIRVVLTLYAFAERFHFDWPFVWLLSH